MLYKNSIILITALGLAGLQSCRPAAVDRELCLAMEDDIITLDPHLHDDSITHSVLFNIYDPLVAFDEQMRITPALAVSWENPDDLTWIFHLRPGVAFHDGQKFTAEDVKFSLDRARNTKVAYYVSTIKAVKVVDSLTVEIVTYNPSPVLLNKLTFVAILPRCLINPAIKPVGTGAYVFAEYRKGQFLKVEANQHYWNGRPAILKATFKVIPKDEQRSTALLNGEIHLARDLEGRDKQKITADRRLVFINQPGLGVSHLGFNFKMKGPLTNRKVRQAIFWALDPQKIIDQTRMEATPCDQMVSPYILGYVPDLHYDRPQIEKAKLLLKEAGYARGFEVTLEMSKTSAVTDGPAIAKQLAQVGIKVKVSGLDWAEFSNRLDRQQSQFFKLGWACSSGDASDLFDACLHSKTREGFGTANMGGYSNRTLDRLIERSGSILNQRERIVTLHEAQLLALDELPLIPLYVRNRTFAYDRRLAFKPRQDGRITIFETAWTK